MIHGGGEEGGRRRRLWIGDLGIPLRSQQPLKMVKWEVERRGGMNFKPLQRLIVQKKVKECKSSLKLKLRMRGKETHKLDGEGCKLSYLH